MTETLGDLLELAVVVDPMYSQNCYVLHRRDSDAALLIDPGLQHEDALRVVDGHGWSCERVLLTHGHGDHVNGVPAVKAATGCSVAMHSLDTEQLVSVRYMPGIPRDLPDIVVDEPLVDGQVIDFHDVGITVLHTPGHTRGSVCFVADSGVVSGDTLFHRGIGRSDLPGGSWDDLVASLQTRVYALEPSLVVYPGHGESTTIGEEMRLNPFVVHPRFR